MMSAIRALDEDMLALLEQSTITGFVVRLPGKLHKNTYAKIDKVLQAIGGKWNRRMGGHLFERDPAPILAKVTGDGSYVDQKQLLGQFDTPPDLADQLVMSVGVKDGDRVLDPSIGPGNLIAAALRLAGERGVRLASVAGVEIDPARSEAVRPMIHGVCGNAGMPVVPFTLYPWNFLDWASSLRDIADPGPLYDLVLANPPYARAQDAMHIMTAWDLVAPGGRMAAICSETHFIRSGIQATDFRNFLTRINATVAQLPEGSFRPAGTGVRTRIIVAKKGGRP